MIIVLSVVIISVIVPSWFTIIVICSRAVFVVIVVFVILVSIKGFTRKGFVVVNTRSAVNCKIKALILHMVMFFLKATNAIYA